MQAEYLGFTLSSVTVDGRTKGPHYGYAFCVEYHVERRKIRHYRELHNDCTNETTECCLFSLNENSKCSSI